MQTSTRHAVYSNDAEWNSFFHNVAKLYTSHKITKQQALTSNLAYYWKDTPCDKGHLAFHTTDGDMCRTCTLNDTSSKHGVASYAKARRMIENRKRDQELDKFDKDYYNFDLEN